MKSQTPAGDSAYRPRLVGLVTCLAVAATVVGCSSEPAIPRGTGGSANPPASTGGAPVSGGTGGATSSGGVTTPGTGGRDGTGGVSATGTGGAATGGAATGGATAGGGGAAGGVSTGGGGGRAGGGAGPATGGGGGTAAGGRGGGTPHTGVWKVMPLGDSVTGSTCYPQVLSKDLIASGHTNFQFIGTVTNNCGNGTPSVKTEGHGGYGVTYLPATSTRPKCTKQPQGCGSYAELQTWAAEKPDMVLMHYATNDCWDGQPTQTILAAYLAVIAEFRKQNPNVVFFVSKIIPLTPAPANAMALNDQVTPAWAAANSTATSPIHIIDHWTGFNASTDTVDGVHPNAAGAQKMSTATVAALTAAGYF